MSSPLGFGDCGALLDCGWRPGMSGAQVEVGRAVFDYSTGVVTLDGHRFPYLIHEDGPTVELNGHGYPVLMTVPAIFLVDDLHIGGAPKARGR